MNSENSPIKRMRLLAVLLLIGVFAAGLVAGAAVNHVTGATSEARQGPGQRVFRVGRPPPGMPGLSPVEVLRDRLDLTDEQSGQLNVIFERRRDQIEGILGSIQPVLRAQMDSTDREIRALLTAQQQEQFDELVRTRVIGAGAGPLRVRLPSRQESLPPRQER